ncbi:beta-galactosidase [Glycomyces buryatensis]|uniref:Beta-galactosidase n=1 Tax=Glycomyces buryatensis TaxID=2570927 RepID=A0A4S8Q6Z8_9ACTN|nr:beta-galactosidase [Glycomyces buryatensis]THV38482.1 beta-galactosidase [Glycomyces buryatensis]
MHWPKGVEGLCYGGDYNPEQWPEEVWDDDVALMREAGVNLVSVGVFSWARLEPRPGEYDFGWLDRVMDKLHSGGIGVNLATPTASPPPWFTLAHPDALNTRPDGVRQVHGSRDTYDICAPAYREASRSIAAKVAERYAGHPALAMWHVHNEYGSATFSAHAETNFRAWLQQKYSTLEALNAAWWGSFWSQHYSDWDQILAPRATQYLANPAHELDFKRFTSDAMLGHFIEQRDILRAANPEVPITTNLVFGQWVPVDPWRWASEVDLIAFDSYPGDPGERAEQISALHADLSRSWAGGGDWLLMEQNAAEISTPYGPVSKTPGRMARHSMIHISRGSKGAMYFQWRAGRGGAEQWHSALVPHAGKNTRMFREVVDFGQALPSIAHTIESPVKTDTAILWSPDSWWATGIGHLPAPIDYFEDVAQIHRVLRDRGVVVDFVSPEGDLSGYRTVFAPSTYVLSRAAAENLRWFTAGGGRLVASSLTGAVDEHCQVWLDGYLGGLTDLFGIRVTEHLPQPPGELRALWNFGAAEKFCELVELRGAQCVTQYAAGDLIENQPAVTVNPFGEGEAWYVSCKLVDEAWDRLFEALELQGPGGQGVDVIDRGQWRFIINHTTAETQIGHVIIPAGSWAVDKTPQ